MMWRANAKSSQSNYVNFVLLRDIALSLVLLRSTEFIRTSGTSSIQKLPVMKNRSYQSEKGEEEECSLCRNPSSSKCANK